MVDQRMPLSTDLAALEQPVQRWTESELERRTRVEAGQCVVANVRTTKKKTGDHALVPWAKETGRLVYIGNFIRWASTWPQSKWGNKFELRKDGPRDLMVAKHRALICSDPLLMDAARHELPGRVLGCWCYPEQWHGDFLAEIANGATASI